jgi:hypothetical protein
VLTEESDWTMKTGCLSALRIMIGMFLVLFSASWGLKLIFDSREGSGNRERWEAVRKDVLAVGEQLRELEKTKERIELDDLRQRMTLSVARWEDFKIHPFGSDGAPFVEYAGKGTVSESYFTYMYCYRNGVILTSEEWRSPNDPTPPPNP